MEEFALFFVRNLELKKKLLKKITLIVLEIILNYFSKSIYVQKNILFVCKNRIHKIFEIK